jgi:ceramidase
MKTMDHKNTFYFKSIFLLGIVVICIVGITFVAPIEQEIAYHDFADQRFVTGINNFYNVVSNVLFIIVGMSGCVLLFKRDTLAILPELIWVYWAFFAGIGLVGFGSSYYHLSPSNETLVWDRLPMTIAFMAFFSIIVAEFVSVRLGKALFLPLLLFGIFATFYWHFTEQQGHGDLRLYVLVQFMPMLLIPCIILLFTSRFSNVGFYWLFMGAYLIAKVFELGDEFTYKMLGQISGHTLKHVFAALGCGLFLLQLNIRHRLS